MKKIQVALGLKDLSPAQVAQNCENYGSGLTNNSKVFMNPKIPLTDFTAKIASVRQRITDADAKSKAAHDAIVARDNEIAELIAMAFEEAGYVEDIANASPDPVGTIGLANMDIKGSPVRNRKLGQVQHLSVSAGDSEGTLDLMWDPMDGRANYLIEICIGDPMVAANWKYADSCTSSRRTLANLPSGTQVWVRVRAKAPKAENDGDWSSPVAKFVP